jgi:hypothetical protein
MTTFASEPLARPAEQNVSLVWPQIDVDASPF